MLLFDDNKTFFLSKEKTNLLLMHFFPKIGTYRNRCFSGLKLPICDCYHKVCTHGAICIRVQILHICKMQNLHTYANRSMCTHLLTYAKFARMQKVENLHLPQTKCKSHFAYMQILHICKSGHVNAKQNLHT